MGAIFGSAALSGAIADRASAGLPLPSPPPRPIPRAVRCLLTGARVLTAKGPAKIEDLAIGDLVPTMFGGTVPIQWIGHYPIKKSNPSKPWPKAARPVRIARSALAPNVPEADLCLTQAHGLLIDNVLISAECLINGTTITLDDASNVDTLEFFHVKLEKHDVIYAEGAPVETLLNVDESAVNFAEYFRMKGAWAEEEVPCAPVLGYRRQGGGLRSRVRNAASWVERRRQITAIRNRFAERGIILARELETSI